MLINQLVSTWKVIIGATIDFACFLGTTIPTIATIGTIEPNFKNLSILREQFLQLGIEIFYVEWCAVKSLMAIPRREVKT